LAAFTVGAGILLESPKYSATVHKVATWLVLGGIAVESLCTVLLFVVDERISNAQQSKIIALETRLAPRTVTMAALSERLRGFAGTNFDTAAMQDSEPMTLLVQIEDALLAAQWVQVDWKGGPMQLDRPGRHDAGIIAASGVVVQVDAQKLSQFGSAVRALVSVLKAENIDASANVVLNPSSTTDAIHIAVGRKP
jgi:hypothetical protein